MVKTHTVLVSGASSGIGEAIARRFAQEGHRVIICGRREENLEHIKNELGNAKVHVLSFDATKKEEVMQAISSLPQEFADIDVLVNNAGIAESKHKSWEADVEEWENIVDINVNGILYLTHSVLKGMVRRNEGHIINISSIAGCYPSTSIVYGPSKAFVKQFSSNLQTDLAGKKIHVTAIMPGLVGHTEIFDKTNLGDPEQAKKMREHECALQPDDVAESVHFVTSLPERANVSLLEIVPVHQAYAGFKLEQGASQK